ncbi:MAG: cyclic nucleotide-binding domain-containing protein [Oligoflexales bacterium]|nr:cyclic nucleotide-binding domain-containing protein [Oligoflexales bacterium]
MSDKLVTFGKGQELFRQNSKGGELYFVKTGQVELTVTNEETGQSAVVATVGPQSVLGTMTFLEGEPRSATGKALSEVTCIVVNQIQREALLKTVPKWFQVLLKDLSGNLRQTNLNFAKSFDENEKLKKRVTFSEEAKKKLEEEKVAATKKMTELEKELASLKTEVKSLNQKIDTMSKTQKTA